MCRIIETVDKSHGSFRIGTVSAETHSVAGHIQARIVIPPSRIIGARLTVNIVLQCRNRLILAVQLRSEFIGLLPAKYTSYYRLTRLITSGKRLECRIVVGQGIRIDQTIGIKICQIFHKQLISLVHRIALHLTVLGKITVESPVGKLDAKRTKQIRQRVSAVEPRIVAAVCIVVKRNLIIRVAVTVGILFLKRRQHFFKFRKGSRHLQPEIIQPFLIDEHDRVGGRPFTLELRRRIDLTFHRRCQNFRIRLLLKHGQDIRGQFF